MKRFCFAMVRQGRHLFLGTKLQEKSVHSDSDSVNQAHLKRHRRIIPIAAHQRVHTAIWRHGPNGAVPVIAHIQRIIRRVDRNARELAKERGRAAVAVAETLDAALAGDELDLRRGGGKGREIRDGKVRWAMRWGENREIGDGLDGRFQCEYTGVKDTKNGEATEIFIGQVRAFSLTLLISTHNDLNTHQNQHMRYNI
jgi:hypothetical protein